jgi:hypothetical protein
MTEREIMEQTLYASAARTATPTAVEVNTRRFRSLVIVLDATAITSTPSITIAIDRKDNASGKYINILTSAAIATVSTNTIRVGLGLPVTANVSQNEPLPNVVRITVTHGNANSITYTCSAHLN